MSFFNPCARRHPKSKALQCQFMIGIEQSDTFDVKSKIIGRAGCHMKTISTFCGVGTKFRLRGKGSGFKEGPEGFKEESTDELMLCVSAPNEHSFNKAKKAMTEHLEKIYVDYAL